MHLYIAYKRYSSWSLRAWLAMKMAEIEFTETLMPFAHDDSLNDVAAQLCVPPIVPILEHEGAVIWDSLAILEELAEQFPEKRMWPREPGMRAIARSASAEMHSGFNALRTFHPMNCPREIEPGPDRDAVQTDLNRLAELWQQFSDARSAAGEREGAFLTGAFCNVDAMFAPIALRVKTSGLRVSPDFDQWCEALMALPAMQQWMDEAAKEEWRIPKYD